MLSNHRLCVSAWLLVLVTSGVAIAEQPAELESFSSVTIRFKQPPTPPANVAAPLPTAAKADTGAPTVPTTDGVARRPVAREVQKTKPQADPVKQVQYEHSEAPGSITPKYTLAQNPLDDLQKELKVAEGDSDGLGGIFDELNGLTAAGPQADAKPLAQNQNVSRSPIDSILGGSTSSRDTAKNGTGSDEDLLGDIDANNQAEGDDTDAVYSAVPVGVMRDDAYYQSLGVPHQVRRADRRNMPLTMGNIFGDEDAYDPACVRRYCESVWQCAGGRNQNFVGRSWREFTHTRQVRMGRNCGNCNATRNDFKCRKLTDQDNYQNNYCPVHGNHGPGSYGSYSDGGTLRDGAIYIDSSHAGANGIEAYEDLSQIGDLQQAPIPSGPAP